MAGLWFFFATDHPKDHPYVNAAEAALIEGHSSPPGAGSPGPVPWKAITRTPTVWWLTLSYTCLGYVAYVYMSWFYLYLVDERGFDIIQGGLPGGKSLPHHYLILSNRGMDHRPPRRLSEISDRHEVVSV